MMKEKPLLKCFTLILKYFISINRYLGNEYYFYLNMKTNDWNIENILVLTFMCQHISFLYKFFMRNGYNHSRISTIRQTRTTGCERKLFRMRIVNFNSIPNPFSSTPNYHNMLVSFKTDRCTRPPFVLQPTFE